MNETVVHGQRKLLGYRLVFWLLLLVLGVYACAGSTGAQEIEITFDGEGCQYAGSDSMVEGQVVFTLNNPTDHPRVHLHVFTFAETHSWQDLVDHMGGSTDDRPTPIWVSNVTPTALNGNSGPTNLETYYQEWIYTLEAGEYGVICAVHGEGIWLAGPFEIEPAL